jgi:streptogramin lyase
VVAVPTRAGAPAPEYAKIETKSAPTHFRQKANIAPMKRPVPASRIRVTIVSTSTSTFAARVAANRTDTINNLLRLVTPPPRIGRLRNGEFSDFKVAEQNAGLSGLVVADDGAVWFGMVRSSNLGRLRDGKVATFPLPRDNARPYSLTVDPDGNVWYADISGYVGMLPAQPVPIRRPQNAKFWGRFNLRATAASGRP